MCPLLGGQVRVTRAYHADDLVPISVFHGLQSFFDEGILVGQRAYKTCAQHCLRNPTDPLLIHLVVYILEIMKCGDGATSHSLGDAIFRGSQKPPVAICIFLGELCAPHSEELHL